ncbi:MAG TPA: ABC transporter permease [Vicinamibacterales bacterium]|nr:ABC transporter permease [Vicinamibacterales bacterium]
MPLDVLEPVWRDLRYGLRRLARAPLFAAFSVVTIALGIGVTTAAYSLVYDFVLRDLGVRDRARLVSIDQAADRVANFSWPEYADLATQQNTFSGVIAWTWFQTSITGTHSPELASAEAVSGNFFETLGVTAARGRLIQPDDDRPDAPAVAVLSDLAWRGQFDADPAIVGTNIRAAGRVFTVIGITTPAFHGASRSSQFFHQSIWIPLTQAPGRGGKLKLDLTSREERWLNLMGRLAPGHTMPEAQAQLTTIAARLEAASPISRQPNIGRRIVGTRAFDDKQLWAAAPVLFILSLPALVLLVACTNLTNLVLSRGVSRQHEFVVRRALGGSRWQMIREQIADGAVVALAGGIGGVLLASNLIAYVDSRIIEVFGSWPQLKFSARLEPPVLMMAAGATLLALVVSSVLPALQLTRRKGHALGVDATLGGTPRWRGRSNLIALQVAVSVGLFLVTALGVTGLSSVQVAEHTGQDRVAVVDVPLEAQQKDDTRGRLVVDRLLEEARRVPDARSVELATMMFSNNIQTTRAAITSPDRPFVPKKNDGESLWITTISPGALPLMGVSIKYGRPFDDRDSAAAAPVILINAGLAAKLFGRVDAAGRDALVQVFLPFERRVETRTMTIVGVVSDTLTFTGRGIENALYVPYAQHFEPNIRVLARGATDDLGPLVLGLRQAVRRADPDLAISFAGRADSAGQFAPLFALKMFTTVLAALAITTLVLAMVGLYGVLSHVVGMRTRELGLRQALGADASRIVRLILRDGFRPVAEGLLIGCAGAAAIRLMLQPSFEKAVTAFDPIAIALAAGPLLMAAGIACYVPARRASRIDPNVALRDL